MKIFLTVGSQAPFDRLVKIIDKWCEHLDSISMIGQIGKAGYIPVNFKYFEYLNDEEYMKYLNDSNLVISHAGMGTIITCCLMSKPLLVLPRLRKHKEHRNDHQIATVKGLSNSGYIYPIFCNNDLEKFLGNINEIKSLRKMNKSPSSLIEFVSNSLE